MPGATCVLVLEDNETSRFVIRAVLEQSGYLVVEAENPEDAIRRVREEHVDLVIADAILRGANGPAAARRLKEVIPDILVLFISGFPLEQLVNRGLIESEQVARGGAAFLQKPFLPKVLLEAVRRLLGGRSAAA